MSLLQLSSTPFYQRSRRARRPASVPISLGVPRNGLLVREAVMETAPSAQATESAIFLYNLIPGEYGLRTRPGSIAFATGLGEPVRTVMSYNAVDTDTAEVFAVTSVGIYDISDGGEGPHPLVVMFPTPDAERAGWCSFVNWTNPGGSQYLLVCDEANGYYTYDGATWAPGVPFVPEDGAEDPPDPKDLVYVTTWGERLWFCARDSSTAWYAGVQQFQGPGTLAPLYMGTRFRRGGKLIALDDWTVDGGDGFNDRLIAISEGGDLVSWIGDPDTPQTNPLQTEGRWFVGRPPAGRRCFTDWGGDLMVITSQGVSSIARVLRTAGNNVNDNDAVTRNIQSIFRSTFIATEGDRGWAAQLVPEENIAIFSTPRDLTGPPLQYVLNTHTTAWCAFRDLDMLSVHKSLLGLLFGDSKGNVWKLAGSLDGAPLDGQGGTAVDFSMLTHYTDVGSPTRWKRVQFVRPYFVASISPAVRTTVRYDFDTSETLRSPSAKPLTPALWDVALWDDGSVWNEGQRGFSQIVGTSGMGRHVAVAVRGQTTERIVLAGFEAMGEVGGPL